LHNNLEVLKIAGNPFHRIGASGADDYKLYAIEMLKKLKYLDYQLISIDQRNDAKAKHNDDVADKDQGNAVNQEDSNKAVDQELIDSKIDSTHKLIERILDECEEAQKLKLLSKFNDSWSIFEQAVDEQTQKYQNEIKNLHKEKQRHIKYCTKLLHNSELDAEKKSINNINEFLSLKKHKIHDLDQLPDKALQIDEYETALMDAVAVLEDELMEIEMLLQDAL
jgi:hypothetical protein